MLETLKKYAENQGIGDNYPKKIYNQKEKKP
ncbi:hypothetical protein KZF14_001270 [Campylobacter jejuni]|uniref:Uncharacterized protein n=1 Tax=Campylobacter jejuni TaxID=197 RepID=A0A5T2AI35_CAMJU|nr:hypothetical protein [Campylobacter jejuni]EAI1867022.1 hypothetical protein [Campylobacter coli]APA47150.1 hypothetical protein BLD42_03825 [Campylobacter jejuni]APB39373.1 hypothetical protein BLD40_04065 [Campylobacter jejuni]EAB5273270.1 hypothetical protein [Campylobacter jejuni]EAC1330832.1 hypothetical protein [Campylobacter jejuni]